MLTLIYSASWVTPLVQLGLAILSFHFALALQSSRWRSFLFVSYLYFAVWSLRSSPHLPFLALECLWAQSVALQIIHVFSVLFLEKLPSPVSEQDSLFSMKGYYASYRLVMNLRHLPQPTTIRKHEIHTFVLLNASKLAFYYFTDKYVVSLFFTTVFTRMLPSDFAHIALLTRLGDITTREIGFRSYMAVNWIWKTIAVLDSAHAALRLSFFIFGFDQPEDWPALFGSLGDIRGMRTFWSRFWHTLPARSNKNCGMVVVKTISSITGQKMSRRAAGSVVAFVVFLISGLSHAAVARVLGIFDWADVQWYLLNFTACFVETVALSSLRKAAVSLGMQRQLKAVEDSWVGRVVGMAWVFGFFFWAVPVTKYPRYRRAFARQLNSL